jgi:hypothetical protein
MVVFSESETSELLANCHPRDLRSHVILLRLTQKPGALFRRIFITHRKSGFNKLWLIRYSRRFTFKSAQKYIDLWEPVYANFGLAISWPYNQGFLSPRILCSFFVQVFQFLSGIFRDIHEWVVPSLGSIPGRNDFFGRQSNIISVLARAARQHQRDTKRIQTLKHQLNACLIPELPKLTEFSRMLSKIRTELAN